MNSSPVSAQADALASFGRSPGRFLLGHLALPLAMAVLASTLLMGGVDQWLADRLYAAEGGHWLLQRAWLTSSLVHHGGKQLSTAAALALLVLAIAGRRWPRWRTWSRPAAYVVLAVGLSTLAVSLLKDITHMDCPWDLVRYGGPRPFIGLFESRGGLAASGCFPAGHASAGYAWLSLYFAALATRPSWRWAGLAIGLGAGLVFGISQQLRGAHFLSHDLWSAMTCWCVALGLYLWMLRPVSQPAKDFRA